MKRTFVESDDLHCASKECLEYVVFWEINVLIDVALIEKQLSRGTALEAIMLLPDSTQHWVGTIGANYLIALAWNRLDADVLEPFLAEDVVYVSQHVLKPLVGKLAVMEYLRDKMRTCHQSGRECSRNWASTNWDHVSCSPKVSQRNCVVRSSSGCRMAALRASTSLASTSCR